MTVVTCKLPKKLAAKLERVAKEERRSKQALLREAIERRLKTRRTVGHVSAYDLVKHIVGTLEGPTDLATTAHGKRQRGLKAAARPALEGLPADLSVGTRERVFALVAKRHAANR